MNTHCTVAYGPYEDSFDLAGKTISYVRSRLQHLFNIPLDALPVVNGAPVIDEDNVLSPSARLDFVKDEGFKGLGPFLTPKQLQDKLGINEVQYRQLCEWELPTVVLSGGDIRHPKELVEDWVRIHLGRLSASLPIGTPNQSQPSVNIPDLPDGGGSERSASETSPSIASSGGSAPLQQYAARFGGKVPKWFKPNQWYHLPFENDPPEYQEGRLEGTRKDLSAWLREEADYRELRRRAEVGSVWVRRQAGDHWEVFFKDKSRYAYANRNRLKRQQNNTE